MGRASHKVGFVLRHYLYIFMTSMCLCLSIRTPQYSWNTAKVGVKHQSTNQSTSGSSKRKKLRILIFFKVFKNLGPCVLPNIMHYISPFQMSWSKLTCYCGYELFRWTENKILPYELFRWMIVTIAILEIEKDMSDNLNSYQSRKITLYRILVVFYLQISLLRGNSVTIP
jgi:hypothetical protein